MSTFSEKSSEKLFRTRTFYNSDSCYRFIFFTPLIMYIPAGSVLFEETFVPLSV